MMLPDVQPECSQVQRIYGWRGLGVKKLLLAFVGGCVGLFSAYAEPSAPLALLRTLPLQGVEGRIDHLSLDTTRSHLFVAALGNNTVEEIDLKSGSRIATIRGIMEPQGVVVLPQSDVLVVASGEDGMCRLYDRSAKLSGALDDLDDADNVRYDAKDMCVWVGYGDGALAAIDYSGPTISRRIRLDGHPESFQLETKGNRIFVNVPAAQEIAVVDRQSGKTTARWPVKNAKANFPMALDEKNHRLFVGCRRPAKLLVIDTKTGKVVAETACSGDTDDIFYDALRKRVYVSGGEGTVTVIEQVNADTYRLLGTVATGSGARTSLFDPESGRLYVAVPHREKQGASILVYKVLP